MALAHILYLRTEKISLMTAVRISGETTIIWGLAVLTVINFLQAGGTGLLFDEAYYWYFAQHPAWGYFDHPPMTAWLVWAGTEIFGDSLGVRLLSPILYSASLWLLWRLLPADSRKNNALLFLITAAAVPLLAAYGFVMVPDTPLIFFALIYLHGLKKLGESAHPFKVCCLLSIGMAGVMYSKYHGILLILFTLLPYLRFWKHWILPVSATIALILYTPHLWWLYVNDFKPLSYHLIDRADSHYKLSFTLQFFTDAMIMAGLAFPLLYTALFRTIPVTKFERSLKWLGIGVLVFFFLSSFNRRTQAQWINLSIIPFVYFAVLRAVEPHHVSFRKWLSALSSTALFLLIGVRLVLAFPNLSPVVLETHSHEKWTSELQKYTDTLPVVFNNSYRDAAMYQYHTGMRVFSLNDLTFRENQFDLDSSEAFLQGKKVALVFRDSQNSHSFSYVRPYKDEFWFGRIIDSFASHTKIRFQIPETYHSMVSSPFEIKVINPYKRQVHLHKLFLRAAFFNSKGKVISEERVQLKATVTLPPESTTQWQFPALSLLVPEKAVTLRLGIADYNLYAGFQSNTARITGE